jgi:hypothetical protein
MTVRIRRRGLTALVALLGMTAVVGVFVLTLGPADASSPVDRSATWLHDADRCDSIARWTYRLPGEAEAVNPEIRSLTARATTFTALSCRTPADARGRGSVWTFASPSRRDAGVAAVHDHALRAQLCRLGDAVVFMEAWSARAPEFCRAVGGRLG